MADEIENLDSLNQEIENADSSNGEQGENLDALKKEKDELSEKNKQLFERAKKAEGDLKELKSKYSDKKPEEKLDNSQSDEPDYAKLAFLEQRGLSHPDDQKLVQDEAKRLKLPLTDILQMGHIKSQLESAKDQREAKAGMPKGKGDAGGRPQGDVDYWVDQKNPDGTYKTPEDSELAEKVIEARCKKEKNQNMFSDELYTK